MGGSDRLVEGLDQLGHHRPGRVAGIGVRPQVGYLGPPDIVSRGALIECERDPECVGDLVRRLGGAADEFVWMQTGQIINRTPDRAFMETA